MTEGAVPPVEAGERAQGAGVPRGLVVLAVALAVAVMAVGAMVVQRTLSRDAEATDYRMQARLLEQSARARPQDLDARLQLAYSYQQAGRKREALREYERVLAEEGQDLAALYNAGVLYLELGKKREGEESLLAVLKLAPSHALAARELADHYAAAHQFDQLLRVVLPAAAAHPTMADLQYLAGLGYEKTGRASEAETYYRRALALVPSMAAAQAGLKRMGAGG